MKQLTIGVDRERRPPVRRALTGAAASAALCAACVAFDPVAIPHVAGRYSTIITVGYRNWLETRSDTLAATVTLPDAEERGFFEGWYATAAGDSGTVGGRLYPDGTMEVTEFAQPPLVTLQGATFLHRLYPWCDFRQVGTGTLTGRLSGDSLVIEGRASVICRYQTWGQLHGIDTDLDVRLAGAR
ncbi:MAG: hypothetical protein A3I79_04170 [Gemmatimonadetes bacterium RIFCSPLOWO2_02_FULL_71_11]|nr:MAG: hypothetical protein A3I79_04170 [Gemmatimonadetes bacterium RIFCSPLOWO2_02_FULL_71_11]